MKLRFDTKCVYGGERLTVGADVARFAGGIWCHEHFIEYVKKRAAERGD